MWTVASGLDGVAGRYPGRDLRSDERRTGLPSGRVAPKGWPNRNMPGMGLVSLFRDWSHAILTHHRASVPSTALGAPAVDIGVPDGFLTART